MNAPTSDTGTVKSGMSVARQLCKEDEHDEHDERDRLERASRRSRECPPSPAPWCRARPRTRSPAGNRVARSFIVFRMFSATSSAFEPGRLERGDHRRRLTVERARLLVVERAQLDARDVLHAHARPVGVLADDDVAELARFDEPPLCPHRCT
jgi:hypothetical protein